MLSPIVRMQGIVKSFPGVVANAGIDFDLQPGEIHALLGENGAGKTTLMNVLYGLQPRDAGDIYLQGRPVKFSSVRDAIHHGLGMVHQHFMLIPPFTVAENIILGQPSPREPLLENQAVIQRRLRRLSEQYGLAVSPEAEVWTLSVGAQQRVEILKALYRGAEVLILDEPTAVLAPQEVHELLAVMRQLARDGKSIVFITHKLDEALAASHRITVLRDGKVVDTVAAAATTKRALARMMVGREVLLRVSKTQARPGQVALKLKRVSALNDRNLPALRELSLEVCAGEIVGVAGVDGNGQHELEEVIAGLRSVSTGSISLGGHDVTHREPRAIAACGLTHIPSDRYRLGVLSDFSVADNIVLQRVAQKPFTRRGLLRRRSIEQEAQRLVDEFEVRVTSVRARTGTLSGGNVQKLILARELARNPKVLLAAQPTRGLDVSAIEYVHSQLIQYRDRGVAILLISTELDEILALSDRIAILCDGRIVGLVAAEAADVHEIGLMMAGSEQESGAGSEGQ